MSSTVAPVILKLNFAEFASRVRTKDPHQRKVDIAKQALAWLGNHARNTKNCDTILLQGTEGHPDWSDALKGALKTGLCSYTNSAGNVVRLKTA